MSYQKDFVHEGERLRVSVRALGSGRYVVQVGADSHEVAARLLPDGRVRFRLGDQTYECSAARFGKQDLQVRLGHRSYHLPAYTGRGGAGAGHAASGEIEAPMTGTVLKVLVEVGQDVAASDTVAVVSAMKMEHKLHAGIDGKVAEVRASEGDTVDQGQLLLRIDGT